ncbi:hypothetical protein Ait01nite_057970 [Actinoplanes italicus]|uniref:Uncharacterized protein n=1 Tax=Actinoplanes italicus TaxID=113567 RepID=A0A2T0K5W1_9ACTN|nr:hypothetical protein [Actinoplanes italicus]PRX18344.1 hypothetical protein CLV67_113178 [Actinoplanes italicus]GIE32752.1 hypothetical protein Ait01nite_057970 [Actinoplanes italicus]
MRLLDALRHAMRMRRTGPDDLDAAGRWAAGAEPGPEDRGLAELLAAAKAPAHAEELAGRPAAVAAFAAAGLDAAAPGPATRFRRSRAVRTLIVNVTAGVLLLTGTGAAVAARGGHLPDGAQQRAHDLFSRLGVPAPQTVPDAPDPRPSRAEPSRRPGRPPSAAAPPSAPTPAQPSGSAAVPGAAGWCRAWAAAPGRDDAPWYRDLVEAAGSEAEVAAYCAGLDGPGAASGKPARSHKPPGKPSSLPTPSHAGKK